MLKTILDFFTGNKETDWSQEDREACLKLLVLMMYSDGKLTDEEDQMIRRQIGLFDWKGIHNEDYFLNETIREVRDLNNVQAFIDENSAKISCSEVKGKVLTLCQHISEADGDVDPKEKELVNLITAALA